MPDTLERTRCKVQGDFFVKAINKKRREIAGYFSTADEDRQGESFHPEWFLKSISPGGNYYSNPVVLYHHDPEQVIGHANVDSLTVDQVGVFGEFSITNGDRWKQIEDGDLNAFSWFGYVDFERNEVDLIEVTVTPTPVNPKALFKVKKKALELGLATEEDFPMAQAKDKQDQEPGAEEQALDGREVVKQPEAGEQEQGDEEQDKREPRVKAAYLGSDLESSVSIGAVGRAYDALWSHVYWNLSPYIDQKDAAGNAKSQDQVFSDIEGGFDEFKAICMRVIRAINDGSVAGGRQIALKSLRELFSIPEQPEPAGDGNNGGEEVPVEKAEVQALIQEAIAPIQSGMGEILTAMKAMAPVAPAPAAPAAPAATTPPPAEPAPESSGDAAAVSKGIGPLDYAKLAEEIVARSTTPGAPRGLRTDDGRSPSGNQESDLGQAKRKALVERVKATKYDGPGVELEWRNHLVDALALEMTGDQTFDEISNTEEVEA